MSEVLFFIAGIGAIAGAIGVVALRNPFYNVLALVAHLLSLAALFLLLRAEFLAAAQVIVYAGAVMVLYVFVVAYVGGGDEPLGRVGATVPWSSRTGLRPEAALFGGALLIELFIALLGTGLKAVDTQGAPYVPGFGTPGYIGQLLLTKFLIVFEGASFLLLIAAVGAVVLAKRRGGIDGEEEMMVLTPLDLLRPRGSGTMAEAGAMPHDGGLDDGDEAADAGEREAAPVGGEARP